MAVESNQFIDWRAPAKYISVKKDVKFLLKNLNLKSVAKHQINDYINQIIIYPEKKTLYILLTYKVILFENKEKRKMKKERCHKNE